MRLRVSRTLAVFPQGQTVLVYNYVTKGVVSCPIESLYWLNALNEWASREQIRVGHPDITLSELESLLDIFVSANILMVEGTPETINEQSIDENWTLGTAAALFHFGIKDSEFVSETESLSIQRIQSDIVPSPSLYKQNSLNAIALPTTYDFDQKPFLQVMKERRSNRNVTNVAMTLSLLSNCLFAGLGITKFVKTENAILPLKMTPSGGARNPFEAYVWALNVTGLDKGIFHYSALQHTLEKVSSTSIELPSQYLADQLWTNDMAAIIFLVADIKRTSWKYRDTNAYQVILIEAGHIAQNIMLCCTEDKFTACPTAALAHSAISGLLKLGSVTDAPIYAIAIGKPKESLDTYVSIDEFKSLVAPS
jgi:SagB-type dehydrogenase family enzyme